jgi:3-hydroxyisobutyrate dehydrogenase
VFNRNPEKSRPFEAEGAHVAKSPREAAERAEVIVCMVADDVASREIWLGENGALAAAPSGTVLIEASTLSVNWVKELASLAAAKGCELLDAPVTGTRGPAAAGQLNFFVGGEATTLERVRPVFAPMAKSVTHLGPTGSGAMIKIINNFVCGVQVAALAEALVMIERSGLNRDLALSVLTDGAPGSPLVKLISARMTSADYAPNFMLKLMTKDLGYALQEGRSISTDLATAATAHDLFQQAVASGHGDQDMAALIEQIRNQKTKR